MTTPVKLFLITLAAGFLMGGIPRIINLPTKTVKETKREVLIEKLKPALQSKTNNFHLNKNSNAPKPFGEFNNAKAFIVVDFKTGSVIAEKVADKKLPVASLTKIMTATVALDLAKNEEVFEVSEKASKAMPTRIGVVPGEKMLLGELLYALLLTSANDAAAVIQEGIDKKYGGPYFVAAMNEKAEFLGLKNTNFTNPQGFDDDKNFSSASDLAVLTHYAITNYPLIAEIIKDDYRFLPADKNHKQFDLYNWNGLIGVYPGASGVKVGNTPNAGFTTVVLSTREGKDEKKYKVMVVILGAPGVKERDLYAASLLDLGFESANIIPGNVNEISLKQKYSTWKFWN